MQCTLSIFRFKDVYLYPKVNHKTIKKNNNEKVLIEF